MTCANRSRPSLRRAVGQGLWGSLVGLALVGCQGTVAPPTSPDPAPNPPASNPPTQENSASIRDIVAPPVWVRPFQGEETTAQVGMPLQGEDTIRTEAPALVEIGLGSVVFRLGGNASLTLRPNQTLQLATGQMITWLEGTPSGPVTIQTPVGAAGIRGTTVFVNIDEDPQAPVEIFAWEGEVTFQPTGATEAVVIRDGEQLLVRPGEIDVAALQQQVRRFGSEEFRQRLETSPLINNFDQPLSTQADIEAVGEGLD